MRDYYCRTLVAQACVVGCKAELVEGEVEQHCQDGLSDEEQQQNFILTCSCTPITDVVINHPERKRRNVRND